jgi:hypothetical protein
VLGFVRESAGQCRSGSPTADDHEIGRVGKTGNGVHL